MLGIRKKKIEITIRTDRRLVIRGSVSALGWCQTCGSETEVVSLETAGVVAQAVSAELGGTWPLSNLHVSQTSEGGSQVCLKSLLGMVRDAGAPCGVAPTKALMPRNS